MGLRKKGLIQNSGTVMPDAFSLTWWWCSVTKLCLTLCMDRSMPGFPVLHYLLKFAQTHVHWVSDATQPSHPMSSPSPPAFSLSQHQDLFQGVSSSHQVATVLEFQLEHQSFQWISRSLPRTDLLQDGLVGSPRDSQESSPAPQFRSINSSMLSLYILLRWHLNSFHPLLPGYLSSVCVIKRCSVNWYPKSVRTTMSLPKHLYIFLKHAFVQTQME